MMGLARTGGCFDNNTNVNLFIKAAGEKNNDSSGNNNNSNNSNNNKSPIIINTEKVRNVNPGDYD